MQMLLIVGLGNPGEKYQKTRHNLGFEVVGEFVSSVKHQVLWEKSEKLKSEIIKTPEIIFAKPLTYMNNSGLAVSLLTRYYKIPATDVIIIHDELDLPLGHIKIRLGGSAAGHHGIESVIAKLGTDQFIRVRLGIGNLNSQSGEHKHRSFNAEHFVLDYFQPNEKSTVKRMIKLALQGIETILEKGLEKAQHQFS